jgi:sugar lactone lactonase YvrE
MARFIGSYSSIVVVVAAAAAVASCGGEAPPPAQAPAAAAAAPAPKNAVAPDAVPSASATTPAATAEPPKPAAPSPVAKYTGFSKPESVLYDADNDRYLVSNINGSPFDKDNNGFISVLSPDGQVTTLKWIEGGQKKVKLDAPKGTAIVKGTLYVADITTVRMFDLKSGAPKGEIPIAGSTFLNDVAAGPDGKVYVSDSGLKTGTGGFEPTASDAVYVIDKGKAKALAKSADLHQPNGVAWTDKGLVVCTIGASEVYRLDEKGAKQDVTKTPAGHLDGLLQLGDSLLVTSHDSSSVLRGKLGGTFDTALAEQKTPADIGYDTKRGRLLVPHLGEDTVEAYELK